MSSHHLLVKAAFNRPAHRRPIWLMKPTGAFLPKFQELSKKHSVLELMTIPDLATELSLLPFETFKVDAITVFSDINLLLSKMGLSIEFNSTGALVKSPIRSSSQVNNLITPESSDFDFITQTIQNIRQICPDVPAIGMLGGPFTLAAQMIEGSQSKYFIATKAVMYGHQKSLQQLLSKTTQILKTLFQAQIEAGAEVIQIYDHFAGILSPSDYEKFALPYVQQLIDEVPHQNVPVIYYVSPSAGILSKMAQSGAEVLSIDWRIDMEDAKNQVGDKIALQGNIDPCVLLGNYDVIVNNIKQLLKAYGKNHGLIGGLGHGVMPYVPEKNISIFVRKFQEFSRSYATK